MIKELAADLDDDIKEAIKEVKEKTKQQVDIDTAHKWANRAIACLLIAKQTEEGKERLKWIDFADDYRHEALEHAATADDDGKTLKEVVAKIEKYRD